MQHGGRRAAAAIQVAAGLFFAAPVGAATLHLRAPHVVLGHGKLTLEAQELASLGATALLCGIACCIGLAAASLMACCIYDAVAHWCHRSHFTSCQQKVQRVHAAFLKRTGELPLCPCCVEFISNSPSPSKVVFLCGHRFHMDCANKWFCEYPEKAGRCPICEGSPTLFTKKAIGASSGTEAGSSTPLVGGSNGGVAAGAVGTPPPPVVECGAAESDWPLQKPDREGSDEAQSFILGSLHRRYPEIIPKECVQRWSNCHTELWLSELTCPRWHGRYSPQSWLYGVSSSRRDGTRWEHHK